MRAAVVYKDGNLLEKVLKVLKSLNVECDVFPEASEKLEEYDFIVSVGGDGTILKLLQKLKRCPPIFGINTGRIGLLTHSTPENFENHLLTAVKRFKTEEFPRLSCLVGGEELLALNEFAIVSEKPGKLISVKLRIDGVDVDEMRCDGMIVATQIGSTGYAFSAGGPVVDPYVDAMIVVPIAPFRFGWKPWVFDAARVVEVEVERALLIADGQTEVAFEGGVEIKKSEYPAVFFLKDSRFRELAEKVREIR